MEFSLEKFVNDIRQNLYDNFPYEPDSVNEKKHKNRPLHIRDIAFMYLPTSKLDENTILFDIGSDYAEENYPYYHILEDAEVIRKRGKSTKTSRGSQASISPSKRDYGRIRFNGKTYSYEYRKNVRGERNKQNQATRYIVGSDGVVYKINSEANYYKNIHYHYIERILNETLPWIAQECGLKMRRMEITDLTEEYKEQEQNDRLINYINSEGE